MYALNHSFNAKVAAKVNDLTVRRIISSDYTTQFRVLNEKGQMVISEEDHPDRQSWMQTEFQTMDLFDPA